MKRILAKKRMIICFLAAAFILISGCVNLPPDESNNGTDTNPIAGLVDFYRGPLNRLQAVRGGACPMHPSCSEYSRQAAIKHGPLVGWAMSCDRLMRCGRDEADLSARIYVERSMRIFDPLEANDFWLDDSEPARTNDRPASRPTEITSGCELK